MNSETFIGLNDAQTFKETDNCIVPKYLWREWIEEQEAEVLLVEITQGDAKAVLSVSSHHSDGDNIQVPSRLLTEFEEASDVNVVVLEEMPPNATKIVLQPQDSSYEGIDIVAAVSNYLSHWNVLAKNTLLSVPCEELGGQEIEVFVKGCEPADIVLLRGEVPLDLEESLISATAQVQTEPPTENTNRVTSEEFFDTAAPMFGQAEVPLHRPIKKAPAFVPFSGKSYSLGS